MGVVPAKVDVVVSGGSIAGISSCLAMKAANPRLKITILEPRNRKAPQGASLAIGVNGIKALGAFAPKAAAQLQKLDAGLTMVKMLDGDGNLLNDITQPAGEIQKQQLSLFGVHSVLGVHQAVVDTLYAQLPHDVQVIQGQLCDFEQGPDSVAVRVQPTMGYNIDEQCGIEHTKTIEAGMLVGADGYRSLTRRLLIPQKSLQPAYCNQFVLWGRADGMGAPSSPDISYNILNGQLATLVLCTDPVALVFFGPADALQSVGYRYDHSTNRMQHLESGAAATKLEVARAVMGSQGPNLMQYVDALQEGNTVLRGTERHSLKNWRESIYGSGRVVVVGDAAHAMLPDGRAGGQAIEDAYWLGRMVGDHGLVNDLGAKVGAARAKRIELCLELDEDKSGVLERYTRRTGDEVSQMDYVVRNPLLFEESFDTISSRKQPLPI